MEREILFRGKKIDGDEWIKGFYAENGHGSSNIQPKCKFFGYLVKPETVGQFTNMTDCINNLLFEGDLVRAFDDKKCEFDQSYIGIVKFVGGAFGVEWHAKNFQTFMPFRDIESNIMLVGNIFDNPEMLKNETLAEFQPVIHAKWEISSDGYYPYCKKCNARPENGKMTKYCSSCGAKMDGD